MLPNHRNKRIGTSLWQEAHRLCRHHGASATSLDVDVTNAGARRLYERLGYVVVGPHVLSERFADAFGIAGTPDQGIELVKELQRLVLDRIKVVPALSEEAADLEDVALSRTTMQNEVIPALRGG